MRRAGLTLWAVLLAFCLAAFHAAVPAVAYGPRVLGVLDPWPIPPPADSVVVQVLKDLGYEVVDWRTYEQGTPPGDTLKQYEVVVWTTLCDSVETLSPEEEESLIDYLDSGGKLWLVSQNYLAVRGLTEFARDYLHVADYLPNRGADSVYSSNFSLKLRYPGYQECNRADGLVPDPWAVGLHWSEKGDTIMIGCKGDGTDYRIFFQSYPFEAIRDDDYPNNKPTLAQWIMGGLGCQAIRVTALPGADRVRRGESFECTIKLVNMTSLDRTVDLWLDAIMPSGRKYPGNPIRGPRQVEVPAADSTYEQMGGKVPWKAPLGIWIVVSEVANTYPGPVIDYDYFQIEVIP